MRVARRTTALLSTVALGLLGALAGPAAPARADDIRDRSWHHDALELADLHAITQGEGITVALIDTGVDATHPDLKDNVLPGLDLHDETTKGRVDRHGHGTAMASIIAGHGHGPGNRDGVLGIAPKAKILPVTVVRAKGGITHPKMLAAGIQWAIDHGADVINVSMSSGHDDDLDTAVERAYQSGVVVVAAVGNRDDVLIGEPARHPAVLAVTGSDRDGGLGPQSIPAEEIALAAPSVDLVRAARGGGYSTETSVSGATAVASGAVALVRSQFPEMSPYEVFRQVLETTTDAGPPGRDLDFGWGVLNLRQALTGEPDGRAAPAPSPSADPVVAWEPGGEEKWWHLPLSIAVVLLVVAIPTVVVILLVRWLRRRRRTPPANAVPAGGAATSSGGPPAPAAAIPTGLPAPPGVPVPTGTPVPPSAPAETPTDESAWRRPG